MIAGDGLFASGDHAGLDRILSDPVGQDLVHADPAMQDGAFLKGHSGKDVSSLAWMDAHTHRGPVKQSRR